MTKPGVIAREYVEGKRKKYFNPLTFLVLTSAVSAFILTAVHYYDNVSAGRQSGRVGHPLMMETFRISNDNQKLLSLLLLAPLITILTWLFFKRKKYNLAENFVLNSFVIGESHIVRLLVFVPLFLLMPEQARQLIYVFEGLLLVYLIVAYKQFFGQNTLVTALKTILIMPLYILIYWLLIFLYVYLKHQFTA